MVRDCLPLIIIIGVALLPELTSGIICYSAQNIIHNTVEKLTGCEKPPLNICIQNKFEWAVCKPYYDEARAKPMMSIYGMLVHNTKSNNVAVVDADIAIECFNRKLRNIRIIHLLQIFAGMVLIGFFVWRSSRSLKHLRKTNGEKGYICRAETLFIKNNIHEMAKFNTFIKSVIKKLHIEKSLANQFRLAIEEVVVNVIDYAYPMGQEGNIEIYITSDGRILKAVIIDSGIAFDPTNREKPNTSLSVEERQIGGLGLLLVSELMDTINYRRENGRNILTLVKKVK